MEFKIVTKSLRVLVLVFLILGNLSVFAQFHTYVYNVYYGAGSIGDKVNLYVNSRALDYGDQVSPTFTGTGVFGFNINSYASDQLLIGVDINYTQASIEYPAEVERGGVEKITLDRFRLSTRLEYDYYVREYIELYAVGTAGAKYSFYSATNSSFLEEEDVFYFPLALQAGGGIRYFFNENFGIFLEYGIGGGANLRGFLTYRM